MTTIKFKGGDNGNLADVNKHKAIATYDCPPALAPKNTPNRVQFFRHSITGMDVNGSTTPVKFTLAANEEYDIFITQILLVIGDNKVKEDKYGEIASLTNGVDLLTFESGDSNYFFQGAKNYAQLKSQAGDANSDPKIKSTGAELATVSINVKQFVKAGVRLGRGTQDKICFFVNDDLQALEEHEIYFLGYKHLD